MYNDLKAYKLTLLSLEKGTVLENQLVFFSGELPYIITWKKRSYKRVTVSEREDRLPRLVYAEVSTCELTEIVAFFTGL